MTYGVKTFGSAGNLLFNTDTANTIMLKGDGTYTTANVIDTTDFTTKYGVGTAISLSTETSTISRVFSVPGMVSSTGDSYIPPSRGVEYCGNPNATAFAAYTIISPQATYVHTFGTPTKPATGGFSVVTPDGANLLISENYRSYYLHLKSDGTAIRTGTASSLSSLNSGISSAAWAQSAAPTIFFDKPYDRPPLIFITGSTGYIGLNYINRDGNGKYVSASIVASSTLANYPGTSRDYAGWNPQTFTFDYFIISDVEPLYFPAATQGMAVFNTAGTRVFDSSHFISKITNISVTYPKQVMTAPTTTSLSVATSGISNITINAGEGVCINNFNAIDGGMYSYGNYIISGHCIGPCTRYGHYLKIAANGIVTVAAQPTFAGFIGIINFNNVNAQSHTLSVDYFSQSETVKTILKATYQ